MERIEKRMFRKEINRMVRGLYLYMTVMSACVFGGMIIGAIRIVINSSPQLLDQEIDDYLTRVVESGFTSIVGITAGMLILFFYFRKSECRNRLLDSDKQMNKISFLYILIVFMSVQLLFNVLGEGMEALLNQCGFSIMEQIESASSESTTFSMLLYASFLGPVAEELVFRGFLLRSLEKYGKLFAIVTSAILFGLFHVNFIQGIFAFAVGIILGYVAREYSIKWSIILHIINNFIFGDLLLFILGHFNPTVGTIVINILNISFFIGGCYILLFRKRTELRQYLRSEEKKKGLYVQAFTTIWMLLFMVTEIGISFLGVTRL